MNLSYFKDMFKMFTCQIFLFCISRGPLLSCPSWRPCDGHSCCMVVQCSLIVTGSTAAALEWPPCIGHIVLATLYWPPYTGHLVLATLYWPPCTGHLALATLYHSCSNCYLMGCVMERFYPGQDED